MEFLSRWRGWVAVVAVLLVMAAAGRAMAAPIFDVPQLAGITIDGDSTDWGSHGFTIEFPTDTNGVAHAPSELSATVRLGWNANGLLVLADVRDDVPVESGESDGGLWERDSIELFLATGYGQPDFFQLIITPGIDPKHPQPQTLFTDPRKSPALRAVALTCSVARHAVPGGYQLEVLLPWANLGIKPALGREAALQVNVNDFDGTMRSQLRWFPRDGAYASSECMHRLRLAEAPGAPLAARATAILERFRRIVVDVTATRDYIGKTVTLKAGKKTLAKGTLTAGKTGACVTLLLPLPKPGKPYGEAQVCVAGQQPVVLAMPDVDQQRRDIIKNARFIFQPVVFDGTTFPPGDFEQPSLMEDVLGRYTVKTTFYDAQCQPVTTAATPGRYGAVVEVTAQDGAQYQYYCTLYRQPHGIDWDALTLDNGLAVPQELGIDTAVAREQADTVRELSKVALKTALEHEEESAIVLAGLAETAPGRGKATSSTDAWAKNDYYWFRVLQQLGKLAPYRTEVHLPAGYDAEAQARWPLLIVLHGSGERFVDPAGFTKFFAKFKMLELTRAEYPCVVAIPQCPPDEWWSPHKVVALLDDLQGKYRIDPSRVYLTGYSMGGFGTFSTAIVYPERFAAIAPICGGADPGDASRLQHVPTWVFHGAKDTTVPISFSQEMVDAMKAGNADVAFTIYPEGTHDVWTETFNNPELYRWLLRHQR